MLALGSSAVHAKEVRTNPVLIPDAPDWLTASRVDRIADRIESKLEWDIRQVRVTWYTDQKSFEKFHGYGPAVQAVSRKQDNTIHVGPKVNDQNFDAVFGHELAHIILGQKYKGAIPNWLEEGLANYVAKKGSVDYAYLKSQPKVDVHTLNHPFKSTAIDFSFHYQASTALVEMLAAKCSLADLLQLSVGKKLENFLSTYCGIDDVNVAYEKWIKRH